ncbi:hypothetical protein [Sporosarcina sp. YIM B06819]|uniref:hypothetical protein n=1 Tax=Sporosarcina sp. YIM B06819 TaxID=3081769 RepID=UPI00298BD255|nr:hypothetical protein [Sporosarcina sp. YIM B06819]
MIYATGIISFLSKDIVPTSATYLKNDRVHMEIVEIAERHSPAGGPQTFEVTCRYTASLYEDYACRSLEDYNGKVKPFLQKQIGCLIFRVEVHYLRYM